MDTGSNNKVEQQPETHRREYCMSSEPMSISYINNGQDQQTKFDSNPRSIGVSIVSRTNRCEVEIDGHRIEEQN